MWVFSLLSSLKKAEDIFKCAHNIISCILGSGDRQHEDQGDDSGEPGQRGNLRNHLKNTKRREEKLYLNSGWNKVKSHGRMFTYIMKRKVCIKKDCVHYAHFKLEKRILLCQRNFLLNNIMAIFFLFNYTCVLCLPTSV